MLYCDGDPRPPEAKSCRTSLPVEKVVPRPAPDTLPETVPEMVPTAPLSWPSIPKLLPDLSHTTGLDLSLEPATPPASCLTRKKKRRSAQWTENTRDDLFAKGTSEEDTIGTDTIDDITVIQAGGEVGTQDASSNDCLQGSAKWYLQKGRFEKTDVAGEKEEGGNQMERRDFEEESDGNPIAT